jgi:hypothetical protein
VAVAPRARAVASFIVNKTADRSLGIAIIIISKNMTIEDEISRIYADGGEGRTLI